MNKNITLHFQYVLRIVCGILEIWLGHYLA